MGKTLTRSDLSEAVYRAVGLSRNESQISLKAFSNMSPMRSSRVKQ